MAGFYIPLGYLGFFLPRPCKLQPINTELRSLVSSWALWVGVWAVYSLLPVVWGGSGWGAAVGPWWAVRRPLVPITAYR